MTTYNTTAWGCEFEMSANFAEASCQVMGDMHGRQVADFRHEPRAAMRAILEDSVTESGDNPEDVDIVGKITEALDAMTESDE